MDNYLSARWPGSNPSPQPAKPNKPNKSQKPQKQRKSRRVWRDVLIICLALILLGGLIVGSFFGVQWAAERYLADQSGQQTQPGQSPQPTQPNLPSRPDKDDLPSLPTNTGSTEDLWSPELLPQGAADPNGVIELLSSEGLEPLSGSEIYKKVLPSIVCVEAYSALGYSVGSGIIISESGYIITNYHIVEGGTGLAVMLLSDNSVYDAALVGYDQELDLAILKAEGSGFVPAELGNSDELEVGDTVYAIGNPLGYLYGTLTDGIVSALGDRVSQLDYPGRLIQTTAALNSGNSGGALVDCYGRVVGITSAKVTGVQEDVVIEGLGLAIPLADAQPYLQRIYRTGVSSRPSLGISCYAAEVDGYEGIFVVEVTVGTPAHGRLLPEDLILSANGIPALSVDDMIRVFAWMEPGDEVELVVLRNGKEITVTITLYERLPETVE